MADFGELVLVLGDIHAPSRKPEIPSKIKDLLITGKMQHVLCTGNVCSKAMDDYLRTLAPSVHIVKGDQDFGPAFAEYPETKVIRIGNFRIGLSHGHQIIPWGDPESLSNLQRMLDVDILITGHTHKSSTIKYEGAYLINPGSISGAYSPFTTDVVPSFILMAIKDNKVVCYAYELIDGEIDVKKSEFIKKSQ